MKTLPLIAMLALTACSSDPSPQLAAYCGSDAHKLYIGEDEDKMASCSMVPGVLTVYQEWVNANGRYRIYGKGLAPKWVFTLNGKVTGWSMQ